MAKRLSRKPTKVTRATARPDDRLARALAKQKKEELVDIIVEFARGSQNHAAT